MSKPDSATRLLYPDGIDRGDWIWCISSKSRPHAYGAFDEIIASLSGQEIRFTVSRKRKRIHVFVNHKEWTRP